MSFLTDWTWGQADDGSFLIGPEAGSWFHFAGIALAILLSAVLCRFVARKHSEKADDAVILSISLLLLASEVVKQFFWYNVYGYFRMDTFPFQFCSVPLYIGLLGALVRRGRVKELCYKFLAFYGAIGGLSFLAMPSTLHTYWPFISLQSMLWHVLLVTMAMYLIVSRGYGRDFRKDLLGALVIFLICVALAVLMNELVYHFYLRDMLAQFPDRTDSFPMFFISRHYPTLLPVLGLIQESCPYPVFVAAYILVFFAGSCLLWLAVHGIRALFARTRNA